MELLFRHFALVLVAVTLINAVIAHRRIAALVAGGGIDAADATRFGRRAALWFTLLFVAAEALVLGSGARSPICVFRPGLRYNPRTIRFVTAAWAAAAVAVPIVGPFGRGSGLCP